MTGIDVDLNMNLYGLWFINEILDYRAYQHKTKTGTKFTFSVEVETDFL